MANDGETMLRAAALMRERAEAATPGRWQLDGPFWVDPPGPISELTVRTCSGVSAGKGRALVVEGTWQTVSNEPDRAYIASMHPAVALAVADWLDDAYADWLRMENSFGAASVRAMSGEPNEPDPKALAVARAYVGGDGE